MRLEAQRLVRAGWRAAFLRYLEIDPVSLAALLFLVQVQDPHVGSSAACEEQELLKAQNVTLAFLLSCVPCGAPGQERQPSHGCSARGRARVSAPPRQVWGRAEALQRGGCWRLHDLVLLFLLCLDPGDGGGGIPG